MHKHFKTSVRTALCLLALTASVSAHAQSRRAAAPQAPAPAPSAGQGDKLDVSDLEKKYWAAKDTDFNVVQNRTFSKEGRVALTLGYGMYVGEPYSEGATLGANLNYYFSERYGVELAYSKTDSKDNDSTQYIKTNQGGAPDHGKMKEFYGVAFNWIPFYAKVSVLNKSILYFDMSISPGLGMTTYEQQSVLGNDKQSAPTATLDITQHLFLSRHFALRADFKNRWYQEDIVRYQNKSPIRTDLNHTGLLMFGATFYY